MHAHGAECNTARVSPPAPPACCTLSWQSAAPKKSFYVSFCMSEKMAAEAMAEETSAKYMRKLEEKACSLRLNIYSPDKVKVLTAPTEATMSKWVEHLNNAVKTACDAAAPNVYNEKLEAAEQMKPLMLGQAFKEVDQYHTLVNNLISAGLLHGDDDPRHADNIAKSGKMKMLKSGMDENVWQQFYFVLVDKTVYYYKSRKHDKGGKHNYDDKDDDEDEEDDEDKDEMPWKGCFDVTLATVNQAPEAISKKAKVFQIKTPLRTFILKARHEVDAEEWMSHICASQQGVPVEQREIKLRGFDVYKDPLAGKLSRPETLSLLDILKHPVGVRYFGQYLEANADAASAKMVKSFKSIEKYKTKVVPAKKHKKALKIFKKFVQKNDLIEKSLKNELAEQVEHFDFAASNMFMKLENALMDHYAKLFDGFIKSEIFGTLTASTGPKMVVVSHEKSANQNFKIDGTIYVGRSRENEGGDGYIQLDDDHKVSREHLRIDAGPLAVMVTDLGSSKGTKLGSKDGKKIMTKIILPGQVRACTRFQPRPSDAYITCCSRRPRVVGSFAHRPFSSAATFSPTSSATRPWQRAKRREVCLVGSSARRSELGAPSHCSSRRWTYSRACGTLRATGSTFCTLS